MAKELTTTSEDIGIDISDMMMVLMMIMMMSLMTSIIPLATQSLQAQAYSGLTDNRNLNSNPITQWLNLVSGPPYTGWISASFFNDGWTKGGVHYDWSVFIGVNNPDELTEIASGESLEVDMTGAARRIEFVFYKCGTGEKASVRVIGKY